MDIAAEQCIFSMLVKPISSVNKRLPLSPMGKKNCYTKIRWLLDFWFRWVAREQANQSPHALDRSKTQERNNRPQTDNLRKGSQDDKNQQKEKLHPPPRANMHPKTTKKMRKRWTSQKKLRNGDCGIYHTLGSVPHFVWFMIGLLQKSEKNVKKHFSDLIDHQFFLSKKNFSV